MTKMCEGKSLAARAAATILECAYSSRPPALVVVMRERIASTSASRFAFDIEKLTTGIPQKSCGNTLESSSTIDLSVSPSAFTGASQSTLGRGEWERDWELIVLPCIVI